MLVCTGEARNGGYYDKVCIEQMLEAGIKKGVQPDNRFIFNQEKASGHA